MKIKMLRPSFTISQLCSSVARHAQPTFNIAIRCAGNSLLLVLLVCWKWSELAWDLLLVTSLADGSPVHTCAVLCCGMAVAWRPLPSTTLTSSRAVYGILILDSQNFVLTPIRIPAQTGQGQWAQLPPWLRQHVFMSCSWLYGQ